MQPVEWLLDCTPREVQLEALRRSYYGYALKDSRDAEPNYRPFSRKGPAIGWGHFLEMRLGKTPMVMNEFCLLQKYNGIERMVVMSPNSYKLDWAAEAKKYGLPVPAFAYDTGSYKEALAFMKANPDGFLLIVNYEGTIYDNTKQVLEQAVNSRTLFVLDESIKIKNPNGLSSKQVRKTAASAGYVRDLTGLPMTQGPQDLFAQLQAIRAINGVNFFAFRNTYCQMGGYMAKKVVGAKNEPRLQALLAGCSFNAKRKDWSSYTTPEYYSISLDLPPELAQHYKMMDKEFITMLEDGTEVTADLVVTKMMKLQQISSGFLYVEDRVEVLMPPEKTPKMRRLIDMMEDEFKGKVVVPFHYTRSGAALMESLAQFNPAIITSAGWMAKNGKDVIDEKYKFNNGVDGCRVILVQISAGKYGHDLSGIKGDRTSYMFFYENTYSLDDRGQIEARISIGEGQDWTNVYLDFVASKVERNATKALQQKENVVASILGAYHDNKTLDTTTHDYRA